MDCHRNLGRKKKTIDMVHKYPSLLKQILVVSLGTTFLYLQSAPTQGADTGTETCATQQCVLKLSENAASLIEVPMGRDVGLRDISTELAGLGEFQKAQAVRPA